MNKIFTLAHLSDFHLFSLIGARFGDLLNKRVYAYLRWRTHRFTEHRADILEALATDLKKTEPDHSVITGDLTHSGLAGEYLEAERVLRGLGSPAHVTAIPGNHDKYVAGRDLSPFSILLPYMGSDPPRRTEGIFPDHSYPFPTMRVRRHVALIGLSTARPSLPFLAVGRLGVPQLTRFEQLLAEAGGRGLFRIVLIHHPPCEGMVSWRKRLLDLDSLGNVLAGQGAELVLHGHTHRRSYRQLKQPRREIPVIGVSASTSLGRSNEIRARYHVYSIPERPTADSFRIRVRVYSPASRSFVEEPFSSSEQAFIGRS